MKTITLLLKLRLPLLLFCFAIFCPNKSSGQNITNVQQLSLTSTQVTIGFDVNPNNASTTVRIQYSLQNNNFGAGVQTATFPTNFTGNSVISQSLLITGLFPDRVYYYRVWGQNANGSSYVPASSYFNFITPAVAPSAVLTFSNLTSSAITGTTATVSVDLANVCSGSNYRMQYSTSNAFLAGTVDTGHLTNNTSGTKNHNITGLIANTQYFFRFYSSPNQGCGNAAQITSAIASFTTLSVPTSPAITAISASGGSSSALISYTINANNAATTSIVKYGLTSGSLSSQVAGSSATGSTATSGTASIQGLLPTTQYFYQIEAVNSIGSVQSAVGNFTTLAVGVPVAEYSFDNTYNNINGNTPFTSNAGTSFTTDRHSNLTGAININNAGSTATILGLPYGNAPRTVSVWVKINTFNAQPYNFMFSYGGNASVSRSFGGSVSATNAMILSYNNNYTVVSSFNLATWYHYVCTYDGTTAKMYRNGVLLSTGAAYTWNTINNNNLFRLGVGVGDELWFNGAIDDLKIYNFSLSQTEVTSLFTNNSLASINFNKNNLKVFLFPNPIKDMLYVETASEIKSVAVYGILGNQVLTGTSKDLNVSNLEKGIYMVQIQDMENNISTKKIIKE